MPVKCVDLFCLTIRREACVTQLQKYSRKTNKFLHYFKVSLKMGASGVFVSIPHGTGRLCGHYGKHSGSKVKQDVNPARMFTTVSVVKTFFYHPCVKQKLLHFEHI